MAVRGPGKTVDPKSHNSLSSYKGKRPPNWAWHWEVLFPQEPQKGSITQGRRMASWAEGPSSRTARPESPRQLRRPQSGVFHTNSTVFRSQPTPQSTAVQGELSAKAWILAPSCSRSDRELKELVRRPFYRRHSNFTSKLHAKNLSWLSLRTALELNIKWLLA